VLGGRNPTVQVDADATVISGGDPAVPFDLGAGDVNYAAD
jgi:hypothetical protein